jgi:crossover junction endodeoxyribonuclease RuvC
MNILALDPGITTGLALVHVLSGSTWVLDHRCDLRPQGETRGAELSELLETLRAEINMYSVAVIAMEEMLSYGGQSSADEKVESQAIIKLVAWQEGVPLVTYAPTTIRSAVVGSGRATPKDISTTLRFMLRMGRTSKKGEAFSPHQADAVSVALCHALRSGALQVLDRCEEVSS